MKFWNWKEALEQNKKCIVGVCEVETKGEDRKILKAATSSTTRVKIRHLNVG